ncbi:MAG: hypothetical protein NWS18_04430 [Schleiferiaceae bacterium]|nr:hypothetical protein [Schleiferiaceae bacterium]MDP4627814.1 hypothetical protein [Schleiferiaceae bacterium]MDP4727882.1 hypothetical protein [Schleiferiaceae bacterium]MDP4749889.1 hypothetical protein [Schleiferiaceae bacterium]MDP4859860.1 hypothetical protein [Schleiferiaceae bacterium]
MQYWATSVALGALVAGLPARANSWKSSGLDSVVDNQTAPRTWNAPGIQWKQRLGAGLSDTPGAQKL